MYICIYIYIYIKIYICIERALRVVYGARLGQVPFLKLPAFLKLTNTDPAWFVVTEYGIRVMRSVLGAISYLSIVAFSE